MPSPSMSVTEPTVSVGHYTHILTNAFYGRVFANTFLTALLVSVCCLLLGFPLAYLMANSSAQAAWASVSGSNSVTYPM